MKNIQHITEEKLAKYFDVAKRALAKVNPGKEQPIKWARMQDEFLDMARRYVKDAEHYYSKGDKVTAFAALNYAHGWLDAGARLGLFDVDHDSELFAVD